MPDFLSIYITFPLHEEAEQVGRTLVEERLAACVNIIPGVHSIYRWQDAIEEADEVVLIAKTRAALFDRLEKRVKQLHSYDCPCIVAWPIEEGHQPFLDWLAKETAK